MCYVLCIIISFLCRPMCICKCGTEKIEVQTGHDEHHIIFQHIRSVRKRAAHYMQSNRHTQHTHKPYIQTPLVQCDAVFCVRTKKSDLNKMKICNKLLKMYSYRWKSLSPDERHRKKIVTNIRSFSLEFIYNTLHIHAHFSTPFVSVIHIQNTCSNKYIHTNKYIQEFLVLEMKLRCLNRNEQIVTKPHKSFMNCNV